MKNFKSVLLIVFGIITIIAVMFFINYIFNNNDNNINNNSKLMSEIKYVDAKLTSMLNDMNNINLENYKIYVSKTSTSASSESQGEEQSQGSGESSNSEETQSQEKTSDSVEQYGLEESGILTNNTDVNWKIIKNDVEQFYSIIPTITLDLYDAEVNQNEILNFNKDLDELTVAIKEESKEKTLNKLASLYGYLPMYAKNISEDSMYLKVLETKSNILFAYSLLEVQDWQGMSNYVSMAIEGYTSILNNINEQNEYAVNKVYISLNELKNAVDMQDREIFLIKYKNVLEEIEDLE